MGGDVFGRFPHFEDVPGDDVDEQAARLQPGAGLPEELVLQTFVFAIPVIGRVQVKQVVPVFRSDEVEVTVVEDAGLVGQLGGTGLGELADGQCAYHLSRSLRPFLVQLHAERFQVQRFGQRYQRSAFSGTRVQDTTCPEPAEGAVLRCGNVAENKAGTIRLTVLTLFSEG